MSGSSSREFQKQINQRIDEFVDDISRLAREHAYRSLAEALELAPKPRGASAARSSGGGGRRKRGQRELEEVCAALLRIIAANPGRRMQELAAELRSTPKELALPAKRLIADKLVRTEGQKRSTSYFPTARGKKRQTGS